ncbi:MAG TPA: hypothetical protein VGM50_06180 [Gemmatimonadaceae bacterium]
MTTPPSIPRINMAAAAAIILRRERDIVQTFRGVGATDPARAREPGELGVDRRVPFRLLVKHAVLREAENGRFYLDERSWEALRSMRHRIALIVLIALAVVFIALAVVFLTGGNLVAQHAQ